MAVEVKRKGNESSEGLLRRFQDKVKRSRTLTLAKKSRFYEKEKNKKQIRKSAKVRDYNRSKREYLIKIGKLPEISSGNSFRRK